MKRKTFIGGPEGQVISAWLNSLAPERRDPILRLVRLAGKFPLLEDTRTEIAKEVADTMRRWKVGTYPQIVNTESGGYTLTWREDWNKKVPARQVQAFFAALKLIEWGLLARVKQCARPECAKWFFGVLPTMRYHDKQCQQVVEARDEQRRERRAQAMRNYRKKKKEKKQRTVAA